MYFLNIFGVGFNYTVKLLSQNSSSHEMLISYSGYEDYKQIQKTLKNTASTVFMEYSDGEQLLLKGFSDVYKKIITTIPASDNSIHFNFIECKDFENHHYATVKIGSQNWMAENLKATAYRNGDSIPYILIDTNWMNTKKGAYGYYNNNANMAALHGNLYNFYAVKDIRNLCPAGWKIPNENDWNSLTAYLSGELTAGGKMKETGNLTWINNTGANNSSGFTGLGSGMRSSYGYYSNLGSFSYYWSDYSSLYSAFYRRLNNSDVNITTDFSSLNDGYNIRCIKDTSNMISYLPVLTTIPVTNITITSAHSGGNVTQFGGSAIVNRGLCYSTSPNPTIDDSVVYLQGPSGNGAFVGDITGLTGGTTYYVRAFVVNAFSVAYGNEKTFTTQLPANGGLTDIDGNVYDTIVIGNQVWMRQNLKVTKYNNGDALPHITANAAWSALTSGAYCNYGNNTSIGATYGMLYNYYVVSDNRNVCPQNWHVPHLSEWQALETYLGGSSVAGGKLKEVDTIYWASPNADATNSSGFTALAGGSRSSTGVSGDLGYYGNWWTNDEYDASKGIAMDLSYGNGTSHLFQRTKSIGMSIRCIKDTLLPPSITDADGNVYDTIHIGNQVWLKQNLKTTRYANGNLIPHVSDSATWSNLSSGAYINYNNDTAIAGVYGKLYNWHAVVDSRNLCPDGWHIPSDNEWNILTTYLGGQNIAGGKLKEAGTLHWNSPNTGATNETDFTALPGGLKKTYSSFQGSGDFGFFWSSTEEGSNYAYFRILDYISTSIITMAGYNNFKTDGMSVRCIQDSTSANMIIPTVTTVNVSSITATSAVSGGVIVNQGGSTITSKGVCYNTSPNPTILNGTSNNGSGSNNFSSTIQGLNPNTTYYLRAYATNSFGTAYGNEIVFTTLQGSGNAMVYDADGNAYDTIHIGNQVWMKQNLKTTKYNNGDSISYVTDGGLWGNLTTGAYCNYNNIASNGNTYGRLYNWYAVSDSRNLCPMGWHVADTADAVELINYLGGSSVAGGKLKEAGLSQWQSPNTGATNSSGFTALAGGYRYYDGNFYQMGNNAWFWANTEYSAITGFSLYMSFDAASTTNQASFKPNGYSVRCVKTASVNPPSLYKVYDIDGNAYDTVHIGTQIWMMQNLKTTKFRNGNIIPNITVNNDWAALTTGAYSNYNNDTAIAITYGRLYNYASVADTRGLCPSGWHVPDNNEWNALNTYLGGESVAGGKLKEAGLSHWNAPNDGATNQSGFTALPAGHRHYFYGDFGYLGEYAQFWSATQFNSSYAYYESLYRIDSNVTFTYTYKNQGFSVRCIKDTVIASFKVYDIDGNAYDTVHIGTQLWLKQNLKTTKLNNGTPIPNISDTSWNSLNTPAYCFYNNSQLNGNVYGALYNWHTVNTFMLCPTGWHVAGDYEWTILTNYLGGDSIAGAKLKEAGSLHWSNNNPETTNESGFTALPGGYREISNSYPFNFKDTEGIWWCRTESNSNDSWVRILYNDTSLIKRNSVNKKKGFSVRCIKDITSPTFKVYDIDGNAYDTVHVGSQVWMKQNLKTTKFNNGDAIPDYVSNSAYSNLTTAAYSNYNNDTTTASIYGKMYNWYAVNDSRGLCPSGWHVPTDSEFLALTTYLGGDLIAGGKLKETGLTHWASPNAGASNNTAYTALPGGYRNTNGSYANLNYYCYYWSANESTSDFSWYYYLSYNYTTFNRNDNNKKLGHSVRCLKN